MIFKDVDGMVVAVKIKQPTLFKKQQKQNANVNHWRKWDIQ